MSPVSTVFHTAVTVSIVLKSAVRLLETCVFAIFSYLALTRVKERERGGEIGYSQLLTIDI